MVKSMGVELDLEKKETNADTDIDESIEQYNGMRPEGLGGLGNIPLESCNETIGTPYGFLKKHDEDKRKIAVDVSKFKSASEYSAYIKKWLQDTGVVHIVNDVNTCTENTITFALENTSSIIYTVCILYNISEVKDMMSMLDNVSVTIENVLHNKVIFGHMNFGGALEREAKAHKIEFIGLDDIHEINNIIDSAISNKPYFSISTNKMFIMQ